MATDTTSDSGALRRIVVVDDEPANLMLADTLLRSDGHGDVMLVRDPRDLLARYAEAPIELIVLDLNMPHTDYEVMAQLRALGDPLLPPILVLAAQVRASVCALDWCGSIGRLGLTATGSRAPHWREWAWAAIRRGQMVRFHGVSRTESRIALNSANQRPIHLPR